jgi:hypothetical protein
LITYFPPKKRARVHFIPNQKVGVFVTLRTPDVIKQKIRRRREPGRFPWGGPSPDQWGVVPQVFSFDLQMERYEISPRDGYNYKIY